MSIPDVLGKVEALLHRELDELNYAIETREGHLAKMYERRAELERKINDSQPKSDPQLNGGEYSF